MVGRCGRVLSVGRWLRCDLASDHRLDAVLVTGLMEVDSHTSHRGRSSRWRSCLVLGAFDEWRDDRRRCRLYWCAVEAKVLTVADRRAGDVTGSGTPRYPPRMATNHTNRRNGRKLGTAIPERGKARRSGEPLCGHHAQRGLAAFGATGERCCEDELPSRG